MKQVLVGLSVAIFCVVMGGKVKLLNIKLANNV